jgi:hypothetical protein
MGLRRDQIEVSQLVDPAQCRDFKAALLPKINPHL